MFKIQKRVYVYWELISQAQHFIDIFIIYKTELQNFVNESSYITLMVRYTSEKLYTINYILFFILSLSGNSSVIHRAAEEFESVATSKYIGN